MSRPKGLTIACIAADLNPGRLGGAEHHCVEIVKRLAKKHKIYLYVGKNTSIKSSLPQSVSVIPIVYPKIPNFIGLSYLLFGFLPINFDLSSKKPDLLWAKQTYPQAPLAALLKIKHKLPLYITAQNPLLHHEELVLKGRLFQKFHKTLTTLLDPLVRFSYRQADLVAAVSKYSANLAKNLGAPKVIIIPNGTNLPIYTIRRTDPKIFTIVSTSSLIPRNGLETLVEAVTLIPKKINLRLFIAGDGFLKTSLISQIRRSKMQKRIILLGRIPNHEVPKLLSRANLFVRPSRKEGFGVAFIEAMACGLPVIGTPVGGIPDFLTHQKTGLMTRVDDPKHLAKQILTLKNNPKVYSRLQKNALNLVKKRYTWDRIANLVDREFLKLAKTSPKLS